MLVQRCFVRAASLCAVAMLTFSFVGCEPSKPAANTKPAGESGHKHEELALGNFGESVGTLRKIHDEIKTAFDAGKPDDAHHALHEMAETLTALEKQAADVPADKQEAAKAAVKALFDGYTKIDKAMHDGDEIKYADFSDDLSKNVAALEAAK